MLFELADCAGMACTTSQCSTILPLLSTRKISTSAVPRSCGILAEHMQRHQIALGYHLFDLTAPLRVGLQNFGKGIDKRLRAIAYIGVVLDILAADMLVDRFLQLVLIKGQLVLKASS